MRSELLHKESSMTDAEKQLGGQTNRSADVRTRFRSYLDREKAKDHCGHAL